MVVPIATVVVVAVVVGDGGVADVVDCVNNWPRSHGVTEVLVVEGAHLFVN